MTGADEKGEESDRERARNCSGDTVSHRESVS